MAGVSTAIRVSDQMSPALRGMNKALMIVINSFERMQSVANNPIDVAAIEEARSELAGVSVTLDEVDGSIRRAHDEQERYTREVNNTRNALSGVAGAVKSAVAAYATLQTAEKAVQMSDRISSTTARLSMIVDDGGSVQALEQQIFESANRARANYMNVTDSVGKLSLNAPDAFASNAETIRFAETLNKMFAIAGTETAAVNSATLQLTQALGSGVLRGEELNAVFEAAPNIIQEVADYMGVSIGQIRELASEGQVTAETVKYALLSASDEVDQRFSEMPVTFSQVWNMFQNYATEALNPVWEKMSAIANNQSFNNFVIGAAITIGVLGNVLVSVFGAIASLGSFVYDNWAFIAPIIGAVTAAMALYLTYLGLVKTAEVVSAGIKIAMCLAAYAHAAATGTVVSAITAETAAQCGLNTALLACPLTWILLIIIAVIAAIYLVVAAINKVTGSTISGTGVIAGAVSWCVAFIVNLLMGVLEVVFTICNAVWDVFATVANFLANVFSAPIASIIHLFGGLADAVLGILEGIANAIDKVFGSNLAEAVSGWRSGLDEKVESLASKYGEESYKEVVENVNFSTAALGLERMDLSNAYDSGYSWGKGVEDKISNFSMDSLLGDTGFDLTNIGSGSYNGNIPDYDELAGNVADIAENTGGIHDAVEISEEDLKYLRDAAEMETINRFTTAEISVDMGGVNNNINSDMDIDGFMDTFTDKLYESMTIAAEGVHE